MNLGESITAEKFQDKSNESQPTSKSSQKQQQHYHNFAIENIMTCDKCKGMGKFPIFLSEIILRKCNKCKGTGWEESVCHKCNGNKMNLLTGVKCSTCKGVGSFQHRPSKKNPDGSKCKKCEGVGDVKINKQSKKVGKFEKCKHCDGSGKTNCKVSKCVLSFSDGEKIKKVLIKKS